MTFRYRRRYTGPLQAVIFDWAGTTCDFGCIAPAEVFVEVFRRQGVRISLAEARVPMGMEKRAHIEALCADPAIRARWREVRGAAPDESALDAMYADFVPLQIEVLARYATLIPGTVEAVDRLRARGMRIGSNTGYSSEMTRINLEEAARQGYRPDSTVSADQVRQGRPGPAMCLMNAVELAVDCVQACIKVDDTVPGIEEGLNAGMWTIGCAISGNEVGLAEADWRALGPDAQQPVRERARRRLSQAGAHVVIDSVADLLPAVGRIEGWLAAGESP